MTAKSSGALRAQSMPLLRTLAFGCGTVNDRSTTMAGEATNDWNGLETEAWVIRAGTLDIAVTSAGSGPALVLLHGIGSRGVSWVPVAEELASEFRLVILELRGHGGSAHPDHGYLLADYARDLDAVLNALGLDHPLIVGHSLGGMAVLQWAIANPARAAAIVIEDSPMIRGGDGVAELFDGWIALSRMSISEAEAFYAEHNPEWSEAERHRRAVGITSVDPGVFAEMRADMLAQGGTVVIPSYSGISSPVLLVYGDVAAGGMVPSFHADAFTATVPGSRAIRIPGGTHSLHRDSKPEFLASVLPFLREHSVNASRIG
jgi:pimeloyl-ACP methyl ester carboxylesterase